MGLHEASNWKLLVRRTKDVSSPLSLGKERGHLRLRGPDQYVVVVHMPEQALCTPRRGAV